MDKEQRGTCVQWNNMDGDFQIIRLSYYYDYHYRVEQTYVTLSYYQRLSY